MKFATRYLLPLEMFMALQMLSWGISGGFGGGYLWRALEKTQQNTEWGVALCLVGALQLVVAASEWLLGRRWADALLSKSVAVRVWSAFLSFVVWVYVCYMVLALFHDRGFSVLMLQALSSALFSVWVLVENMKLGCVLDPAVPTERLQRRLELERSGGH